MTLIQFIDRWINQKADFDNAYEGQCVDLVRYYIKQVLNYPQPYPTPKYAIRGAADFYENFETVSSLRDYYVRIPNTIDFIPKRGDIAIFNRNTGGGDGHISIVIDGQHNDYEFYTFDQNWTRISFCEIVKHSYVNLLGVLRPNKNIEKEENMSKLLEYLGMPTEEEAIKRLATHLGGDKKCQWGDSNDNNGGDLGAARRRVKYLENENDRLRIDKRTLEEKIENHECKPVEQKVYKLTDEIGLVIIK